MSNLDMGIKKGQYLRDGTYERLLREQQDEERVRRETLDTLFGTFVKKNVRASGWQKCWGCGKNVHTNRAVPLCKECEPNREDILSRRRGRRERPS